MADEEKAYDVDKEDPQYKIKMNEIVKKRFEQEKLKSIEREKAKLETDKNRGKILDSKSSNASTSTPSPSNGGNSVDSNTPVATERDPEEFVKRKEIVQLVKQINNSFSIIEKHRLKVEKFLTKIQDSFKEE